MMLPTKKDYAAKLKELGVSELYWNNLRAQMLGCPDLEEATLLRALNSSTTWFNFIATSFVWEPTPEGFEYWSNIARTK